MRMARFICSGTDGAVFGTGSGFFESRMALGMERMEHTEQR